VKRPSFRSAGRPRHLPHAQWNAILVAPIQRDLEGVRPGPGQGQIEDQHRARLHVRDSRGRLAEVHRPFALDQLGTLIVYEADPHPVLADLGAPTAEAEHQVGAGMHRREVGHPDMLEQPEHRQLALLVDEGVVCQDGEVE
jgi:hypothetical protein